VNELNHFIQEVKTIHIIGASLKAERASNQALSATEGRGWRMVPVNSKYAGSTLSGWPIRQHCDFNTSPELLVFFLSPAISINLLKSMFLRSESRPFIWLQPGAENEEVTTFLDNASWPYISEQCWVVNVIENDLKCSDPLPVQPWFLQTTSPQMDGCSKWQTFEFGDIFDNANEAEWVGDLIDLELSDDVIPRYIRNLQRDDESLYQAGVRLSN